MVPSTPAQNPSCMAANNSVHDLVRLALANGGVDALGNLGTLGALPGLAALNAQQPGASHHPLSVDAVQGSLASAADASSHPSLHALCPQMPPSSYRTPSPVPHGAPGTAAATKGFGGGLGLGLGMLGVRAGAMPDADDNSASDSDLSVDSAHSKAATLGRLSARGSVTSLADAVEGPRSNGRNGRNGCTGVGAGLGLGGFGAMGAAGGLHGAGLNGLNQERPGLAGVVPPHSASMAANTIFPRRKAGEQSRLSVKPVVLDESTLSQMYSLPLHEAAGKLGISATALKSACRKLNIKKWPYRTVHSLKHMQAQQKVQAPHLSSLHGALRHAPSAALAAAHLTPKKDKEVAMRRGGAGKKGADGKGGKDSKSDDETMGVEPVGEREKEGAGEGRRAGGVGVGGVDSSIQEDARLLAETVMMFRQCASAERNIKNSERDRDGEGAGRRGGEGAGQVGKSGGGGGVGGGGKREVDVRGAAGGRMGKDGKMVRERVEELLATRAVEGEKVEREASSDLSLLLN
jgi:hypothetical protein